MNEINFPPTEWRGGKNTFRSDRFTEWTELEWEKGTWEKITVSFLFFLHNLRGEWIFIKVKFFTHMSRCELAEQREKQVTLSTGVEPSSCEKFTFSIFVSVRRTHQASCCCFFLSERKTFLFSWLKFIHDKLQESENNFFKFSFFVNLSSQFEL